jgi:hypothetical protein
LDYYVNFRFSIGASAYQVTQNQLEKVIRLLIPRVITSIVGREIPARSHTIFSKFDKTFRMQIAKQRTKEGQFAAK